MGWTMANTAAKSSGLKRFLLHHEIPDYPTGGRRMAYLGLAVLATITLYYTYYTQTGVTPEILSYFHMSFGYYVGIVVVSNALGAFASLPASKTDVLGRSNVVIYGILIIGLIVTFGVTNCHTQLEFAIAISAIGIVEGAVLVATPALIRDFSPQMGRASAMGFWTVGPVAGSLLTSVIASHTLSHLHTWQSQFWISGIFSLAVFVLSLLFLKDLSPSVRDQLMVSERDKALVEAKARGVSTERLAAASASPWKQILSWELVGSSLGISLLLLIYFVASAFFTIYYVVTFVHPSGVPYSTADANSLNQWFWGADIVALIVVGWISDKLRVRKPFMLAGTLLAIVLTIIFLTRASHPSTPYSTLVILGVLMATAISIVYAPWMAGYTETVEARNPALVATGLALWGWILRLVVAVSFIFMPIVISSVNPVVNNQAVATAAISNCDLAPKTSLLPAIAGPSVPVGQSAATFQALHPDSVAFAQKHADLLKKVVAHYRIIDAANGPNPSLAQLGAAAAVLGPVDAARLLALKTQFNSLVAPYACQLNYLSAHETALLAASKGLKDSPGQWQTWFWIDIAGMVVFLPFIFLTKGRWSPKRAKQDLDERESAVAAELAAMSDTPTSDIS